MFFQFAVRVLGIATNALSRKVESRSQKENVMTFSELKDKKKKKEFLTWNVYQFIYFQTTTRILQELQGIDSSHLLDLFYSVYQKTFDLTGSFSDS